MIVLNYFTPNVLHELETGYHQPGEKGNLTSGQSFRYFK